MFHEDLLNMVMHKLSDESGIPQFARDTKVLATSSQSRTLAPFHRRRNTVRIKIVLLTPSDRNEP